MNKNRTLTGEIGLNENKLGICVGNEFVAAQKGDRISFFKAQDLQVPLMTVEAREMDNNEGKLLVFISNSSWNDKNINMRTSLGVRSPEVLANSFNNERYKTVLVRPAVA